MNAKLLREVLADQDAADAATPIAREITREAFERTPLRSELTPHPHEDDEMRPAPIPEGVALLLGALVFSVLAAVAGCVIHAVSSLWK